MANISHIIALRAKIFQGLASVVSQAEGLWRVVEPMMEKLNKFGCFHHQ
jgi:hypothetical protein